MRGTYFLLVLGNDLRGKFKNERVGHRRAIHPENGFANNSRFPEIVASLRFFF
jgi:hypothetical protein